MKQVAIPTLHPHNRGGVLAMTRTLYNIVGELGYKPTLLALSDDRLDHQSFRRPFGLAKNSYQIFSGMDTICVGVRWGRIEYGNYLFNIDLWQAELDKFPLFFPVSGTAVAGYPLAALNKPFAIWVATTYAEDRADREKTFSLSKKMLDRISKPKVLQQEHFVLQKARKIFAISQYTHRCIVQKYPDVADKVEVLNFPIDTETFHPRPMSRPSQQRYILSTARFSDPRKNIRLLLDAFFSIAGDYPDVTLRLMGRKPDISFLKYINASPFSHRVELLGYISSPADFVAQYQDAALFVLPSLQEGLGIVVLEAMSCGLPVISTRCGGPESIIEHGQNGFLVDNNNLSALVTAIRTVLNQPERLTSIRKNARATIERSFNLSHFKDKIADTLTKLKES